MQLDKVRILRPLPTVSTKCVVGFAGGFGSNPQPHQCLYLSSIALSLAVREDHVDGEVEEVCQRT
jgi:hypothetical protein